MSGDFSEHDRRGLADWWGDCGSARPGDRAVPSRSEAPDQPGGPAYVVSFGWLPARLPPAAPSIPAPRRAPDDSR